MVTGRLRNRERLELWPLLAIHIVVCCYWLVRVAAFKSPNAFDAAKFHLFFDPAQLPAPLAVTGAFALAMILFIFDRFSFGYFVTFISTWRC